MAWLNPDEMIIRGFSERQRDLLIQQFIYKREKELEIWEVEQEWYHPNRLLNYKPWGARLRRLR